MPTKAADCPTSRFACARSKSLLIEKGYVDPAALDAIVETYETVRRTSAA